MNCLLGTCVSLLDCEGSLVKQDNFSPSVRCLVVGGMNRPVRIHNLVKKVLLKKSEPDGLLDLHFFTVDLIYYGLPQLTSSN